MTFSLDELTQDLGLITPANKASTNSNSTNAIAEPKKGKSFLTAQFPILSTPYFIIYLQGPAEWVDTITSETTDSELLTRAFANSKARALGREASEEIKCLAVHAMANRKIFYTNKIAHKELLEQFVKANAKLDLNKVGSKTFPLTAINNYLDALAAFLVKEGCETNADWLAVNSTASTTALPLDLLNIALADL